MSILYNRIRELANQRKISLAELERNLHFSNGIISTWKTGKPSIDKVEKVANYFDVSTDYLLGRSGVLNSNEQQVIAMFRKQTENMSSKDKDDFTASLDDIMSFAKKIVKDRKDHD